MIHKILEENDKRLKILNQNYDPYTGTGSTIPRRRFRFIIKKENGFIFLSP